MWRKLLAIGLSAGAVIVVLTLVYWVGREIKRSEERLVTDWWPIE